MKITNELRAWAAAWWRVHLSDDGTMSICSYETDDPTPTVEHIIIDMANRIDAMHEHEMTMARGEAIQYLESNASDEYIKLPVDADGVPIRVGDVMEFTYDPPQDQPMFEVSGFGANGTLFYAARGEVVPRKTTNASVVRHHHEPTVEDVLREFADRVCNSGHQWGLDAADTIAEYAAKLRLAGEAE